MRFMSISNAEVLRAALLGLEERKREVERLLQEDTSILSTAAPIVKLPVRQRYMRKSGPRKVSAEGRERIAEAQRKRWAAYRQKRVERVE